MSFSADIKDCVECRSFWPRRNLQYDAAPSINAAMLDNDRWTMIGAHAQSAYIIAADGSISRAGKKCGFMTVEVTVDGVARDLRARIDADLQSSEIIEWE